MLDNHPCSGPIGITPEIDNGGPRLRCLMFYEWEVPFDERCLFLSEMLLSEFGSMPVEGTGSLGKKEAHGAYKKVRTRLAGFLTGAGTDAPSIRVRSAPRVAEPDFFPSALEASMGIVHAGQKIGLFAVDEQEIANIHALANRAAPIVFGVLGAAYGGCWDFPAEYGAGGYVATVITVPRGVNVMANEEYGARLNRWRDNIWHRKLRARQGYFREIYPINFLLDAHLGRSFRGARLSKFMEATGTLRPCAFNEKMYQWDVPDETIGEVRIALEPSGLVLSSPAEPLPPD